MLRVAGDKARGRELAALLGHWAKGGHLTSDLSDALRWLVLRSELARGERLPSERTLAATLGVSRTTVIKAFEELKAEGLLESRVGSGTTVRGAAKEKRPSGPVLRSGSRLSPGVSNAGGLQIDLSITAPPAPTFLEAEIVKCAPELVRERDYFPAGLPDLRRLIADRYSNAGLKTDPDQIIITTGAQQAISLVALGETKPGDRVLIEDPTYFGAIDAYSTTGAQLISLSSRADRIDIRSLESLVESVTPALIHLTPSFANPTGGSLTAEERRRAAKLVDRSGVVLVEDDTMRELCFERELPQPIAYFSESQRVFTIGSFSKTIWSGLRVGWVRVPLSDAVRYVGLKAASDMGSGHLGQRLVLSIADKLGEIARFRSAQNFDGMRILVGLLEKSLPEWTFRTPRGGAYLWVTLPSASSELFQQEALRHGVVCTDGRLLSPSGACKDKIRLSFVHDLADLREGVRRLAEAWAA